MLDYQNGLKSEYINDTIHPNKNGFKVMIPLVEDAIEKVLVNQ